MNPPKHNWCQKKNAVVSIIGILLFAMLLLCCMWYIHATQLAEHEPDPIAIITEAVYPAPELTLTEERAMPIPPQQGRGEPIENLIPMYASDYENDPLLGDIVSSFRRWEWNTVYSSLNAIVTEDPDYLDAYRLQVEVYMINQNYDAALAQIDQILRSDPRDIHALGVSAILMHILGNEAGELERIKGLKMVCPEAAQAVCALLQNADTLINAEYSSQPQTDMIPDAIAVFGQTPKSDGTPSSGLLSRLKKALELANQYPEAKIILSGGDLKTEYTEASVMSRWLLEQGIEESRLILDEKARDTYGNAIGTLEALETLDAHKLIVVATMLHLPRATTTMTIYAESQGYPLEIDSAGGGEIEVRNEDERLYTYVLAARAGKLFTKSDYSVFS